MALNRVTFIGSAGLGALVGAAHRAAAHGGSQSAVCARPATRKLLRLTGVNRPGQRGCPRLGSRLARREPMTLPSERQAYPGTAARS